MAIKPFRLFVSSTFTDMLAERTALQDNVFPRLRTFCRERGARFEPVDLRWGISTVAARDQQTIKICTEEVARCREAAPRPNLLVLLSERYGWCPPPSEVPAEEYQAIIDYLDSSGSIPGAGALVSEWYRQRDDNACPPVYRLLRRTGEFIQPSRWSPIEQELVKAFRAAADALTKRGVLPASARWRYDASATEREIVAGIPAPSAPGRVLCVFRNVDGDPLAAQYVDPSEGARERVRALKARLRGLVPQEDLLEYPAKWTPGGVTTDHVPAFCEAVYAKLSHTIAEVLEEARGDELDEERLQHASFAVERSRIFVGRKEVLEQLESLVTSGSKSPFAVLGPSGSGKSALIAKAANEARERHPDTVVVQRFIGVTPGSSDPRALLEGLCRELARAYGASEQVAHTYEELVLDFRNRLRYAWHGKPLIVFVDALDQMAGAASSGRLPWIPTELPPYARLIVSALPDFRPALERIVSPGCLLELGPLTTAEATRLLDCLLADAHRTLSPEQRALVDERLGRVPLPLFLRLLFERVRHWRSDQRDVELGRDAGEVIRDLFARLSAEEAHGPVLVSAAVGLLAAARYGLAEEELLDVLGTDPETLSDHRRRSPDSPPVKGLPQIVWSRLRDELSPYLVERRADGATVLAFFHRQMGEQARASYLAGDAERARHESLASYFRQKPLHLDPARQFPDLRKLSELPFQEAEAAAWDDLARTLLDYQFIDAKIRAAGPQPLLDDFDHGHAVRSKLGMAPGPWDEELGRVKDALQLSAHVLQRVPGQLSAHLAGRLSATPSPGVRRLLAESSAAPTTVWLRPLTASLRSPGTALLRTLGGHEAIVHRVAVSRSGRYAVSAGNDRTAIVWDLEANCALHHLPHDESVFAAGITADDKQVICAAGPKLVSWELASGSRLRTRDAGVGWIRGLGVTSDGRAVFGSDDGAVGEWSPGDDRLSVFEDRVGPVGALALLSDGVAATGTSILATGDLPSRVTVWDLASRAKVREWPVSGGVSGMACAMNGRMLLTAGGDGAVRVWDSNNGALQKTMQHHHWWAEGVAATPDGDIAISGGVDHTIKVWDLRSEKQLAVLRGHHNVVRALAVLPDGRFLSGADDFTVRLWDLRRARDADRPAAHEGKVRAMALSPDGRTVATGSDGGALKLWLMEAGQLVRTLVGESTGQGHEIYSLTFTADGTSIVSVSNGSTVKVVNGASGALIRELHLCPRSRPILEKIVLSPDSGHFFYGSELFDLATGKVAYVLPEYEAAVLAYLSDGRTVAFVGNGKPVRLWDMEAHREVRGLPHGALAAAMLPGDRLVSVTYDGTVAFWDLATASLIKELHGHRGRIDAVAVADPAGGALALTASGDHDAKLWDLEAGRELASFAAEAPLLSCALSPDGRHAAVGDENGNLHFLAIERPGA